MSGNEMGKKPPGKTTRNELRVSLQYNESLHLTTCFITNEKSIENNNFHVISVQHDYLHTEIFQCK